MSKGLDVLLERIKTGPTTTLISRYLALIAELPDEAEKSGRALDLAALLATPKPAEAMRIAHMVYREHPENVRALDVMIEALTARGRYGKAEVLRLEKEKRLAGEQAGAAPTIKLAKDSPEAAAAAVVARKPRGEQGGAAVFAMPGGGDGTGTGVSRAAAEGAAAAAVDRRGDREAEAGRETRGREAALGRRDLVRPEREGRGRERERGGAPSVPERRAQFANADASRIAELDLNPGEEVSYSGEALDQLFPAAPEARPHRPDMAPGELVRQPRAVPVGAGPAPNQGAGWQGAGPGTGQHAAPPQGWQALPQQPAPVYPATPAAWQSAGRGPVAEPPVSPLGAVVELFDHYWRQGFVGEARELLKQASGVAGHEPWWQARNALLERSRLAKAPAVAAPEPKTEPQRPEDFWRPLQLEMGRLAQSAKTLLVPLARVERLKTLMAGSSRSGKLPDEFIRTLAELDHRLPGLDPAKLLALQWELIQGLWGGAPDATCAAVLEELELTRATPGFWGLFLDALLAAGNARRALVEVRRGLEAKPHLIWAKIAWARLPLIYAALRVQLWTWSEDEGVPALLARLALRPRPLLSGMVPIGASDSSRRR